MPLAAGRLTVDDLTSHMLRHGCGYPWLTPATIRGRSLVIKVPTGHWVRLMWAAHRETFEGNANERSQTLRWRGIGLPTGRSLLCVCVWALRTIGRSGPAINPSAATPKNYQVKTAASHTEISKATQWKPGQSGNHKARPVGACQAFSAGVWSARPPFLLFSFC